MPEIQIRENQYIYGTKKGLSFKYFDKVDDKQIKITGKQNEDGTFDVVFNEGKDKDEKKGLSKAELTKLIGKDDRLAFVAEFMKTQKGGKRGSRKTSRKASRKTSRKGSKKVAKRGSRKGSRKSRKGSKN